MFLEEYRTKLLQAKAKMECLKESNIQLKSYRLSDLEECKLAL